MIDKSIELTEKNFELTRIKLAEERLDVTVKQLISADTDYTLLRTVINDFLKGFAGLDYTGYVDVRGDKNDIIFIDPFTIDGGNTSDSALVDYINNFIDSSAEANEIKGGDDNNIIIEEGNGIEIKGGDGINIIRGENDNDITGGVAKNLIFSSDGDEIVVFGGNGNNIIIGGIGVKGLYGGNSNDFISGRNGINFLFGLSGNDFLEGGSSDDFLDSGSGNDILIGSNRNDFLDGSAGRDLILGGSGDDFITGGVGRDSDFLFGGSGRDTFTFLEPRQGIDFIGDFHVAEDTIIVNGSEFGGGLFPGLLLESQFVISSTTTDEQRFIYDTSTGALFFDADGTGSTPQQQFVQLTQGLALTANNIVVS